MRKLNFTSAMVLSMALSACSLAPTYQRPDVAVPTGWSDVNGIAATAEPNTTPFWRELGSEELNRIMKVALAQNLDLEAALHRIAQARGQARVAGAPLYPAVEASGGSSRTIQDARDATAARAVSSISYEVDLWGKNRSSAAAANQRARATAFDRDALRLVVSSDTATFYSQLLSLNERIRIAENNLRNAEEVLRIIEARFRAGSVSGLEVSQQRVAVNNLRSAVTALEEQRARTFNGVAILVGQAPQSFQAPNDTLRALKVPVVELGPPATLLTARPDIESAEALLRAANADIGAARAAFFPSFTLGVDNAIAAGFGGPAAAATSLANSVLAPIFTGGRLRGNLETVTARQKELAAGYRKTVLTAFQEVEDALAAVRSADEQGDIVQQTVRESQAAYDIAKARFDAGAIDYLTLLETQRSLFQAQDDQLANYAAQLHAFIQLRKALGG